MRGTMKTKLATLCGCCFAVTGAVLANTVYVSDAYGNDTTGDGTQENPMKTIQAGIDKITEGWPSYLWISNGVYKLESPIHFNDADGQNYCIVRSTSGNPADVVIDGQNKVRCIECAGYNTQFRDITVANGYTTSGAAGFHLSRTSYAISNCVVRNCHVVATVDSYGSGLYARSLTSLRDTSFVDCSVEVTGKKAYGGAVFVGYTYNESVGTTFVGNVVISNCFARSTSDAKGGGAYFNRANVDGLVVMDCGALNTAASPTSATGFGGGIYKLTYIDGTLKNLFITNCTANAGGAGLYDDGQNAERLLHISDSTMVGNALTVLPSSVAGSGGGASLCGARYEVLNCRFADNSVSAAQKKAKGAGIYLSAATAVTSVVQNCVFDGNSAGRGEVGGYGGGLYLQNGAVLVSNCVIAANAAYQGGGFYLGTCSGCLLTDLFCISNVANSESIGMVSSSGKRLPVVLRNSYFTGNGEEMVSAYGSFRSYTQGASAPVSIEYCTFVSNCVSSSVSYLMIPYTDNPKKENPATAISNFYVKGCVISSNTGKPAFPNNMNTVTNITYTYADTFQASWWTDVRALHNYNKAMLGGELPFVDLATDRRLRRDTPFIDEGVTEDWMGEGRKKGPMDMGDGTYALEPSGTYGVKVVRNSPVARKSGTSVDYGCFEFWQRPGFLLMLR